jgi:flagellar protein FlbD
MITLTRFNGSPLLINEKLIETCEETPDTVVSLQNGHKYFVKEKLGDILCLSIDYKRSSSGVPLLSETERAAVFAVTNPDNNTAGGTRS